MVENCLSGYNSCMFAYGQVLQLQYSIAGFWVLCIVLNFFFFWSWQTGSGKTYTMMGGIYELEGKLNEDCGLTLRIFEHLFTRIGMVWQLNFYVLNRYDNLHETIHLESSCSPLGLL